MLDASPLLHGFSVDVEEWFHILEWQGAPAMGDWKTLQSRVELGTGRILALLRGHRVRATFFVLGWVAERHPDLIARIAADGHEIGSHGHSHRLVGDLGRDGFARDLDASLAAISRASGRDVTCFRAPGFSIGDAETWALPILASRGIQVDASLFLADRAHGGIHLGRTRPFDLVLDDGRRIVEVPTVPRRIAGRNLSYAGGGYLRLLPMWLIEQSFKAAEQAGTPAILYLHPRELDPDQPRMDLPSLRRFKYYVGLADVGSKVDSLLANHRFGSISEVAAATLRDRPVYVGAVA